MKLRLQIMNILLLVIFGILLKNTSAADANSTSSEIQNFFYKRCQRYSPHASTYDNVLEEMRAFLDYLKYTASLIPEGKKQFCNDEKPKLIDNMREIARKLGECFPKEEKYLPKFLYESFSEFLIFACASNGRNIDDFFSTQGRDCLAQIKNAPKSREENCFDKIMEPFNGILTKNDLCDDLGTAKKCFSTSLKKHCPDFTAFRALNSKFFEAIRKPCRDSASSGTVPHIYGLLIMASYFTLKMIS